LKVYEISSRWSILHLHRPPFRTTCYATQEERATETAAGKMNGAHMPEPTIADNATIADIVDYLNAPEEFVPRTGRAAIFQNRDFCGDFQKQDGADRLDIIARMGEAQSVEKD
jgi:hypothetical protein